MVGSPLWPDGPHDPLPIEPRCNDVVRRFGGERVSDLTGFAALHCAHHVTVKEDAFALFVNPVVITPVGLKDGGMPEDRGVEGMLREWVVVHAEAVEQVFSGVCGARRVHLQTGSILIDSGRIVLSRLARRSAALCGWRDAVQPLRCKEGEGKDVGVADP